MPDSEPETALLGFCPTELKTETEARPRPGHSWQLKVDAATRPPAREGQTDDRGLHAVEYYSVAKRHGALTRTASWMNLGDGTVNDRARHQGHVAWDTKEMSRTCKSTGQEWDTEQRAGVDTSLRMRL
jgi:hypothetical protein